MTRLKPWDDEGAAADLVARLVGGTPIPRDGKDAPPSTHDFDILLPDQRMIALEVTQELVPAIRAQHATEAKLSWSLNRLKSEWVVDVHEPVDARRLNAEIEEILSHLEAAGLESVVVGEHGIPAEVAALVDSLGIRLLHRLGPADPGGVIVGPAASGSMVSARLVADAVEDHASRQDNITKLAKAVDADERHLFIWVHEARHAIFGAMAFGTLPVERPNLSASVDAVWIATALTQPTVWRYDRSGWKVVIASQK